VNHFLLLKVHLCICKLEHSIIFNLVNLYSKNSVLIFDLFEFLIKFKLVYLLLKKVRAFKVLVAIKALYFLN
jgi:hypothetical protein